jgi:hypothetical protein
MGSRSEVFLHTLALLEDGFVARDASSRWRLGSVLFATRGESIALIQKAASLTDAYEFAHLWALPGGMVRTHEGDPAEASAADLTRASLQRRVAVEAGIGTDISDGMSIAPTLGPVVTSYTAKGRQRYTLMVVHSCPCPPDLSLVAADRSVQTVGWVDRPEWSKLAPANCLIVGHLLWKELTDEARVAARPAIADAARACGQWADEIDIAVPPRPWDDAACLEAWRSAFPA